MKCCLCSNTHNLLIQVQAGSGLSLDLCHEHEDTPLFEVAARLAVENEKLREMLNMAKCCGTCKFDTGWHGHNPCEDCFSKTALPKWELAI